METNTLWFVAQAQPHNILEGKTHPVLSLKHTIFSTPVLGLFFTKDQRVHSPRMSRILSDLATPLPGVLPHPQRSLEAALVVAPRTASSKGRRDPLKRRCSKRPPPTRPMRQQSWAAEGVVILWVGLDSMKHVSLFLCWFHLCFFFKKKCLFYVALYGRQPTTDPAVAMDHCWNQDTTKIM